MSNILNYTPGETIATGFVRPKVTALFFDKVWVPKSLAEASFEYFIPNEILIRETKELTIHKGRSVGSYYNYLSQTNLGRDVYHTAASNNYPYLDEFNIPQYRYSKNRNHAIMVSSKSFSRKYKLHIYPVYHNLTDFERDVEHLNDYKLYRRPSNSLLNRHNSFLNRDVFAICIQDFPSVIEEKLSWEQVLDCRKDKKLIQQFRKFTTWATRTFSNASPEQIRETISYELDSYKAALREHGIKTVVGSFSTVVSSASSIASLLTNPSASILPVLSIASISLVFTVNTYFSSLATKNKPIAYLYDIEQI